MQLKYAKDNFGIPYRTFAKLELLEAPDSRLEQVAEDLSKKRDVLISKIAKDLRVSDDEARAISDRIKSKYGYGPPSIYKHKLYKMDDNELAEFKRKRRVQNKEIRKRILNETGWTPAQLSAHRKHCSVDFGIDPALYYASRCFEMDDGELAQLGNVRDSRTLSDIYDRGHAHFLSSKKLFNETYSDFLGRKSWVNRETNVEGFKRFAQGLDEVFCKPLDSSCGAGTFKKTLKGENLDKVYEWFVAQPIYLVEECIVQHSDMTRFYPGSINTVRLFTILYEGSFEPFGSFVRFGCGGITDNYSAGGIACGVDPKTGIILTDGSNEDGERFKAHPISETKFKGFQIPHWDLVLERCEKALRLVDGVNYVGWDVAIREDDVVLVEGNSIPDLGILQAVFVDDRIFTRGEYKKYLDAGMYDDMQEKTRDVMRMAHCSERDARDKLVAAYESDFSYEDFVDKGLYKLSNKQIRDK